MRACKILLLATVLSLGPAVVMAAPSGTQPADAKTTQSWYAVEILVFRYTGPEAAQGEIWPSTVPAPPLKNAVYPPAGTYPDYRPLTEVSTLMVQARQRLAATAGYDPVAEIGWMQPEADPSTTRPVSLNPLPATAAAAAPAVMTAPPPGSTTLPAVQAEGTAALAIAANKPYVQLDLRLCEPPPPGLELQAPALNTAPAPATAVMSSTLAGPADFSAPVTGSAATPAAPPLQCFALRESHQVTPGQMEYFDTAAFGVLALVRPVTPPATAATTPRAAHTPD